MKELLINASPNETRLALIENGALQEIYIERPSLESKVSNIYRGKVNRVLPGIQSAFIDIGLQKSGFIHVSDVVSARANKNEGKNKEPQEIGKFVHLGDEIFVQVEKDEINTKGVRLTTDFAIPSRFLVFVPASKRVGVSQKIADEKERNRLKEIVEKQVDPKEGGYIIRTVAEGATEEELKQDIIFLKKLWEKIQTKFKGSKVGELIYQDFSMPLRVIRDLSNVGIDRIRIDSQDLYQEVLHFCEEFIPEFVEKTVYYSDELPLFSIFNIDKEIQKALEREVLLKSGGSLIIDQNEAMTTIDVNTGSYVGKNDQEQTIVKTNLEAALEIARQVRLRNLGGIIIIDFIDMLKSKNREQVRNALIEELAKDRIKTNVLPFSQLGLIEMTRRRNRESLGHILCNPCPLCNGRGHLKSIQTICSEIYRRLLKESKNVKGAGFTLYVSRDVAKVLEADDSHFIENFEKENNLKISIRGEYSYHRENFDMVEI